jgi:DUF4097 and DUF4098 domain-containing protein YvlB
MKTKLRVPFQTIGLYAVLSMFALSGTCLAADDSGAGVVVASPPAASTELAAPPAPPAPPAPTRVDVESFSDLSGKSIDERRPLNADGRISVNNVSGTVNVTAWDRNEVYVSGQIGSGVDRVDISGDASALSIAVRMPKRAHNYAGDTDLKLYVPAMARVELETVSADVAAEGLKGPLRVNTVSGDTRLSVKSPEVAVTSVSGDVILHAPSSTTRVNSVSGDLHVSGAQGELAAETVSGNLELDGGKFSLLRLKSISGDMRVAVTLTDKARVTGETLSGGIAMSLPSDLSGSAALSSFSGDAVLEGLQPTDSRDRNKKREYQWGGGDGVKINLSSFSGDIRVQRK